MKKSLATLALLSALVPVAASAQTNMQSPSSGQGFSYSGLYGGVDLGFSSTTNHLETGSQRIDQGTDGFSYGGLVGYGMQFHGPWYLGGELGIGNTTGSTVISGGSASFKESQDYTFNADLRGGKVIGNETLLYAKLGWAHTEFDQTATAGSASLSNNESFDGIRFGAGAETPLANNITGRLEAIYTDYGSQTTNGVKYSPTDVGVRFGVAYYFN